MKTRIKYALKLILFTLQALQFYNTLYLPICVIVLLLIILILL